MRAGNGAMLILWRALVTMLVCYIIGLVVGHIASRLIDDSIREYKKAHPIPDDEPRPKSRGAAEADVGTNVDILEDELNVGEPMQDAA